MYPVLKIMHMLNFLDTFSMGVTLLLMLSLLLKLYVVVDVVVVLLLSWPLMSYVVVE